MSLPEKPLDCDCPAEFILDILDYLPGSVRMAACSRCGCSALAEPVATEDRPHDVQFFGYRLIPLSPEVKAWASAWPRFAVVDDQRVYLPASARFETAVELNAAVASARAQQVGMTWTEKLHTAGIPSVAPPNDTPDALSGFVEIWNGRRLNDETPIGELLDAATRFNGPRRLARDVLARRADLADLAASLLWDPNEKLREGGRYLVAEFRLTGDGILIPLRAQLNALDNNHTGELERIATLLKDMGAAAFPALPELEAAASRIRSTDYYAHLDLTKAIEKIRGLHDNPH